MRVADLDLRELLEFEPGGGLLRFAGERVLLLDAVALGLLRGELIRAVGLTAARGILTRFGYAHGRRVAETMREALPWTSPRDWQQAGGKLHALKGLVLVDGAPGQGGPGRPFAEATWRESYEAEQHLLHVGRSDAPACWSLVGFASGYLSAVNGRDFACIETKCVAMGDAACHVVGRPREEWGDEHAQDLAFFEGPCLDATLERVTRQLKSAERRLKRRQQELADAGCGADECGGIVARSPAMARALGIARRVATVDSTVLITGESGSGKERIARLVHDESARAAAPFLGINCGAVTESLLESELFGHARGAFTGATQDRVGLFEAAHGGTLFLDEVGELPPSMQVKLLRVLQEREVRRVGENRSRPVDVRLLAATNRDLVAEVEAGRFRKDLLYRLRVIELRLPPLRERREDVLPLARWFLESAARRMARELRGLTPQAADLLQRHDWPGNVRELENAIERAIVLCDGDRIDAEDLPEDVRSAPPLVAAPAAARTLEAIEKDAILAALAAHDGNQSRTAAALGIGTATLYRKLRKWERGV